MAGPTIDKRMLLAGLVGFAGTAFTPWALAQGQLHTPLGYIRTNWSGDPYSYGAYSYIAKGGTRQDYHTLAKPIAGRLCFAGEATHPDYNSTVHAAYETGQYAAEAIMAAGHENIAIIGAGISGLSAAHRLGLEGRQVTVIEARGRIGGRIWTGHQLGSPLDLGASWIHGATDNPLTALADSLDLARVRTRYDDVVRGAGGRKVRWSKAPDWVEEVVEVQHEAGADLSEINVSAYSEDAADYGGPEVIFPGGYSAIFEALDGDYDLHLNTHVSGVTLVEGGVQLTATDGETATFDGVIVTVPLGVLKAGAVQFTPALPAAKQAAIERLGMGTLDKLYLKFEQVFWDDKTWITTIDTGLPHGQFNGWLNLHKYIGEPIIMAFNGGSAALALASLSDEELVARGIQALSRAYPL